jgi:hypothetical protein
VLTLSALATSAKACLSVFATPASSRFLAFSAISFLISSDLLPQPMLTTIRTQLAHQAHCVSLLALNKRKPAQTAAQTGERKCALFNIPPFPHSVTPRRRIAPEIMFEAESGGSEGGGGGGGGG